MDSPGENRGVGRPAKVPLLVIVGPTAVGKTAVSIEVALRVGGEVISADSMQVYKGLDIGTAKPTSKERKGVPHHLIDVVDLNEEFSVARYQRLAYDAIREVAGRGRLPILSGGTGLYIKAVLDGYFFQPQAADHEVRKKLMEEASKLGAESLHKRLERYDPEVANRISPTDVRRVVRALEVLEVSGKPLSYWERLRAPEAKKLRFAVFGLRRSREDLRTRIRARVRQMLELGLVEEVARLVAQGYGPHIRRIRAITYVEALDYLEGKCTLEEAERLMVRNTARLAKRQMTWFRADSRIRWLNLGDDTIGGDGKLLDVGEAVEILSRAGKSLLA